MINVRSKSFVTERSWQNFRNNVRRQPTRQPPPSRRRFFHIRIRRCSLTDMRVR